MLESEEQRLSESYGLASSCILQYTQFPAYRAIGSEVSGHNNATSFTTHSAAAYALSLAWESLGNR